MKKKLAEQPLSSLIRVELETSAEREVKVAQWSLNRGEKLHGADSHAANMFLDLYGVDVMQGDPFFSSPD